MGKEGWLEKGWVKGFVIGFFAMYFGFNTIGLIGGGNTYYINPFNSIAVNCSTYDLGCFANMQWMFSVSLIYLMVVVGIFGAIAGWLFERFE